MLDHTQESSPLAIPSTPNSPPDGFQQEEEQALMVGAGAHHKDTHATTSYDSDRSIPSTSAKRALSLESIEQPSKRRAGNASQSPPPDISPMEASKPRSNSHSRQERDASSESEYLDDDEVHQISCNTKKSARTQPRLEEQDRGTQGTRKHLSEPRFSAAELKRCGDCGSIDCPCTQRDGKSKCIFLTNTKSKTRKNAWTNCRGSRCLKYHLCCIRSPSNVGKTDLTRFCKDCTLTGAGKTCNTTKPAPQLVIKPQKKKDAIVIPEDHENEMSKGGQLINNQRQNEIAQYAQPYMPYELSQTNFRADKKREDLSEGYIKVICGEVYEEIAEYERRLRGIETTTDLRAKLACRDGVKPLRELVDFQRETTYLLSPKSCIVNIFRVLLDINPRTTVLDHVRASVPEFANLKISPVIIAAHALLLQNIISIKPRQDDWRDEAARKWAEAKYPGGGVDLYMQERALWELEAAESIRQVAGVAHRDAKIIADALKPLTELIRPDDDQLTELRYNFVHQMHKLAALLRIRLGTFDYIWPATNDLFDPTLHQLAPAEDFPEGMPNAVKRQQRILMTIIFGISRDVDDMGIKTYAKASVILRRPFVNWPLPGSGKL